MARPASSATLLAVRPPATAALIEAGLADRGGPGAVLAWRAAVKRAVSVTLHVLLLLSSVGSIVAAPAPGPPPIDVTPPKIALAGLTATVTVQSNDYLGVAQTPLELRDASGAVVARGILKMLGKTTVDIEQVHSAGPYRAVLPELHEGGVPFELRVIPGWLSLLPPLLAIVLALLFRQVVPALVAGVSWWLGVKTFNALGAVLEYYHTLGDVMAM